MWPLLRHSGCHFGVGTLSGTVQTEAIRLTPLLLDWARPDLPVFPAEASSSKVVQVKMPDSLRKEYNFPAGKLVEIPNPLYSYKFQPGTQENIKVSHGTMSNTFGST